MHKKLTVFVCRGNILRSTVAEELARKEAEKRGLGDKYIFDSRGLQGTVVDTEPVSFPNFTYYGQQFEDLKPLLGELKIDLSMHVSTPIDREIAEKAGTIFAMDKNTQQGLLELFPEFTDKVHLISELVREGTDVIDPELMDSIGKEKIVNQIRDVITDGFLAMVELIESSREIKQEIGSEFHRRVNRK